MINFDGANVSESRKYNLLTFFEIMFTLLGNLDAWVKCGHCLEIPLYVFILFDIFCFEFVVSGPQKGAQPQDVDSTVNE